MEPGTRTHDALYLQEDRYDEPKEIFKFVAKAAKDASALTDGARIIDVGCAAGEFLYYLARDFPGPVYQGLDVMPELLEKARQKVPGVDFSEGSALDPNALRSDGFECVFSIGVLTIFDEFEPYFENLLNWAKPSGNIFVFTGFNPSPADVWIRYRPADTPDAPLETGWNYFSEMSVSRFLSAHDSVKQFTFSKFSMPFDIKSPNRDDPARSWTVRMEDGSRKLTNGLGLLRTPQLLHIRT